MFRLQAHYKKGGGGRGERGRGVEHSGAEFQKIIHSNNEKERSKRPPKLTCRTPPIQFLPKVMKSMSVVFNVLNNTPRNRQICVCQPG